MSAGASRQNVHDLQNEVMRLLERHRVLASLASRLKGRSSAGLRSIVAHLFLR
jgi:hypothetical protein